MYFGLSINETGNFIFDLNWLKGMLPLSVAFIFAAVYKETLGRDTVDEILWRIQECQIFQLTKHNEALPGGDPVSLVEI